MLRLTYGSIPGLPMSLPTGQPPSSSFSQVAWPGPPAPLQSPSPVLTLRQCDNPNLAGSRLLRGIGTGEQGRPGGSSLGACHPHPLHHLPHPAGPIRRQVPGRWVGGLCPNPKPVQKQLWPVLQAFCLPLGNLCGRCQVSWRAWGTFLGTVWRRPTPTQPPKISSAWLMGKTRTTALRPARATVPGSSCVGFSECRAAGASASR